LQALAVQASVASKFSILVFTIIIKLLFKPQRQRHFVATMALGVCCRGLAAASEV
jgi:hypothetical protein